jgi:hypothetical protein
MLKIITFISVSSTRVEFRLEDDMKEKISKEKQKQETQLATKYELDSTPAKLIEIAITKKADLDKLERLLDLQLRWEANEAKKAYISAMAEFKANPPMIEKDRHVEFKTKTGDRVSYDHATLANVTHKINQALSQYGLSAAWETNQEGAEICVTCKITHVMGHSEKTALRAPSDQSGSKNAIQAIGSTVSYLERYTLLSLTGLATSDMDDDARSAIQNDTPQKQEKDTDQKNHDDGSPVSIAQATLIIQNIIGSHLTQNFEKWRFAKTLFDGQNLLTKTKASNIIEWWIGKKVKSGKVIKEGERTKRAAIEKEDANGEALAAYMDDAYKKYQKKYPKDMKRYSVYCGTSDATRPFNIIDHQSLLKAYLKFRTIIGLDDSKQGGQ